MEEAAGGDLDPGTANPPGRTVPGQQFEVRINGLVPDDVLSHFPHVEIVARELRTSLRGHFRDQAELHGFLATLRTLGLDVVEIRRLASAPGAYDARTEGP